MDGDALGFSSIAFNLALCGFAIYFPQPDRALSEWKHVLAPNGKLIVCVVAQSDERWNWFNELLVAYHERYGFRLPRCVAARS
jgi:ubiquinone/menaquinone biosynthesis C-methylase UbiE